jgi:hypothetical protein
MKDLRDSKTLAPQATNVFHASIQPLLQLKVGPIAFKGLFQFDYWDFKVRSGDTTAYEATFDTLLPDGGWTLSIDADLLYLGIKNLAIGLRYSRVDAFYRQEHFAEPGVDNAAAFAAYDGENDHHRVGLFAAYTLHDRGPATFGKSTVLLIASWYLAHRYRTGQPDAPLMADNRPDDFIGRGVPYVLVGYAFESDFIAPVWD